MNIGYAGDAPQPLLGFQVLARGAARVPADLARAVAPVAHSHDVQLSLPALREDSPFASEPVLGADGSNLAGVINFWRSGYPAKAERLDALMSTYVPEIRKVLALPVSDPVPGFRLWFEHVDGTRFDAQHVSDGVLYFTGLIAHISDAGQGALVFMEEPENAIHPRRLHDLIELMRRLRDERGCQFIVATHSPVLVDEFRDEPDAILLFQRGPSGTRVKRLTDVPALREDLGKTNPGDMLAAGFFNESF